MSRLTAERARAKLAELQSRTYVFEIVPLRAPEVSRTVEFLATDTLEDLHDAIQDEFRLDRDHLYAFYMSNRAWDRSTEFGGPGRSAATRELSRLDLAPGRKFLYIFDFGDELRHEITVRSFGTREPGAEYPRTLEARGTPPPQYEHEGTEAPELAEDLQGLAEEVAAVVRPHEERERKQEEMDEEEAPRAGEQPPPPRPREELLAELALARRLREALAGRPEQIDAIDAHQDIWTMDWLAELPFALARAGLLDEALELCADLAELYPEEDFPSSRIVLLARAGRAAEALPQIEEMLGRAPDDLVVLDQAAGLFLECGQLDRAESLSRRVLAEADAADLPELADSAGDRLVDLLRDTGREAEAAEIERSLGAAQAGPQDEDDEDLDGEDAEEDDLLDGTGFRVIGPRPGLLHAPAQAAPKVGRNQPCPCGSGKKYKKCCLNEVSGGAGP